MKLFYLEPVWLCEVRFYYVETLGQRRRGTPKDSQEAGMEEGSLGAGRRCALGGLLQDWMNLLLALVQS